ncbi:hypothetical protein IFM89_023702 [Coptis chinensis]|uniref:Uncharacterized protein n=1 Tax=Coptis chinensis TaxID=261450 RepID=A0A835LZD7_9MAGN|nr:hypothetical protein IFM89_023702 [Coptis chinensis]
MATEINGENTEQLVEKNAADNEVLTTTEVLTDIGENVVVVIDSVEKAVSIGEVVENVVSVGEVVETVETFESTVVPFLTPTDMLFQILLPPIQQRNSMECTLPLVPIEVSIETSNAFAELDIEEDTVPATQPLLQEIGAVTEVWEASHYEILTCCEKLKKHGGLPVQRFLIDIRLENWANAYFCSARYGEMCSTLAEYFNA